MELHRLTTFFLGACGLLMITFDILSFFTYEHRSPQRAIIYDGAKETQESTFVIVVVVKDRGNDEEYAFALNTVICYAQLHNYQFRYIDISSDPQLSIACPQKDIMFQRHCVTEIHMRNTKAKWTVFLDADIGVINPNHRLEEYLKDDAYIIFYNRFYNDEIASGSYIVENSERGRAFLQFWSGYYYRLPNVSAHGTDNGAIHSAVVEYFHSDLDERRIMCEKIWRNSRNYNDLFDYETCMRLVMREVRGTVGYYIFDKAKGWTRDGWLTKGKFCKNDFMFHGWKQWKINGEWDYQFAPDSFKKKCIGKKSIEQWKYLPGFESTVKEVNALLDEAKQKVDKKHHDRVKRILSSKKFVPFLSTRKPL